MYKDIFGFRTFSGSTDTDRLL